MFCWPTHQPRVGEEAVAEAAPGEPAAEAVQEAEAEAAAQAGLCEPNG